MKTCHIYPALFQVERAKSIRGRPSYTWRTAYIQAGTDCAQTLKEWRMGAQRDGEKLKIHSSKEDAETAAHKETPDENH